MTDSRRADVLTDEDLYFKDKDEVLDLIAKGDTLVLHRATRTRGNVRAEVAVHVILVFLLVFFGAMLLLRLFDVFENRVLLRQLTLFLVLPGSALLSAWVGWRHARKVPDYGWVRCKELDFNGQRLVWWVRLLSNRPVRERFREHYDDLVRESTLDVPFSELALVRHKGFDGDQHPVIELALAYARDVVGKPFDEDFPVLDTLYRGRVVAPDVVITTPPGADVDVVAKALSARTGIHYVDWAPRPDGSTGPVAAPAGT